MLYAKRLTSTFPEELSVVFFVNSGSEANDLALRLAKAHTKGQVAITLEHAYHGHVQSLIDISPYKGPCPRDKTRVAPVADIYRGKYRDVDNPGKDLGELYASDVKQICQEIEAEGKKPTAFIADSLQSCGGQIIFPKNYLRNVYKHVRDFGGVCIADEVQVGFGRVGTHWWAFQTQDVVPDIVTVGKPMGNGHPVAAVITTKQIAKSFSDTGIGYFNTYGGNPVSCAIASAVLDVIEDESLMKHAVKIGDFLKTEFTAMMKKHKMIGDVRGWGMFIGVDIVKCRETREPDTKLAHFVVKKLREEKILLQSDGPHDNVLKFKSPLVFNMDDALRLLNAVDKILSLAADGKKVNLQNGH